MVRQKGVPCMLAATETYSENRDPRDVVQHRELVRKIVRRMSDLHSHSSWELGRSGFVISRKRAISGTFATFWRSDPRRNYGRARRVVHKWELTRVAGYSLVLARNERIENPPWQCGETQSPGRWILDKASGLGFK